MLYFTQNSPYTVYRATSGTRRDYVYSGRELAQSTPTTSVQNQQLECDCLVQQYPLRIVIYAVFHPKLTLYRVPGNFWNSSRLRLFWAGIGSIDAHDQCSEPATRVRLSGAAIPAPYSDICCISPKTHPIPCTGQLLELVEITSILGGNWLNRRPRPVFRTSNSSATVWCSNTRSV